MFEFDDLEFKGSSGSRARAAKIRLLDGLIRLLELREEELERRISLLEAVMDRRRGGGYGDLPESVPIKLVEGSS
ncbi:MAG: hypothetical protein Q8P64_24830 [Deltaproteobacteria bacterium]|nr:hypothetical protein [Deltaproteobacteria bacterium]